VAALETPFRDFFEKTHRSALEGKVDIPPSWAYTWYGSFMNFEKGYFMDHLVNDPALR
jgi:hypothetical protein